MGKPSAPTPPDPQAEAQAQTGTNVSTAVANANLNHVNQVTPYGNLNYSQSGTYNWTDPSTNQTYNIPQFTATQTLSPQQQSILDQSQGAQLHLATTANNESDFLQHYLGQGIDYSGVSAGGNAQNITSPQYQQYGSGPQLQSQIGNAGQIATGIGQLGNIQNSVGNAGQIQSQLGQSGNITNSYDYSQDTSKYQDTINARLLPQQEQDRAALQTQLANQGIQIGSPAYASAMQQLGQQQNDARTQSYLAAGQEQSRLAGLAQQQAQFQNSAQLQGYNEQLGAGNFANQAQAQQYGQLANNFQLGNSAQAQAYAQQLGLAQFQNSAQQQQFSENAANTSLYNSTAQQQYDNQNQQTGQNNQLQSQQMQDQLAQFNAQNTQRQNELQQLYAQRNQPLNEVSSLLSGSQLTQPSFVNTPSTNIPTTDIAGLMQQNYANQMSGYQSALGSWNSTVGGILGGAAQLGGAWIRSDRDSKKDIHEVGETHDGQPIYAFRYKDDESGGSQGGAPMQLGLMAQDVEKHTPEAVAEFGGVKHVDYAKALHLGHQLSDHMKMKG